MTISPPPYIHRPLPVRWCLQTLTSNGWTHQGMDTIGGHRAYSMIAPDGLEVYLSTYGLRRAAMEMWFQYEVKTQKNFVHPLSGF